jgi:ABC-2 type transport system permease protein
MRRLRALMKKEFIHMRRDPRTLTFIFIMPILQLFLLGYAVNTDVKNVPAVTYDQDNTQASRDLLDAYRAAGYFQFDYVAYSQQEVNDLIDSGRARAGIIIPPGYGNNITGGRPAQVAVLIDGSDPGIASAALSNALLISQAYSTQMQLKQLSGTGAGRAMVDVRPRVLYNPNLLSSFNLIPGLIGTILQMSTLNMTAMAIVRERERGTIEQLVVTPIRNFELMIAKITPYILVSMVNVIMVMLVGTLWFGVPVRGSIILLLALTGLYIIPNLGIGLLISTFAHTQQEAQFASMPIMLPSMMLSGFLFPLASLPVVLQWVARFIPLTYFLEITRGIIVKGIGLNLLITQTLALTGFAVALVILAARRFKKTIE